MAVVTEERRLRQLAKIELRNICGNPPPCAPSSTAHLLVHLPERFDGTHGPAAQAFLQQTGLYCLAHPDRFPDDRSKIIFMLTKLSGNTTKWAQPLNQRCKGKAQKALRTFNHSGNVESYTKQLNVHAYDSAWSDNILVSLYRGRLKENI
ncbi:uncharacterized protein VP01_4754g3 [Puccinia sorghi]|uniref:DUF4939 domain-containing protein n=1 Tax=Puccinia sorghi TaxID=27349 RepID=A0A0L6UNN1_9BASI|nr:uncharacterized protein VP01_4754g3 [Puccinia sorghi]